MTPRPPAPRRSPRRGRAARRLLLGVVSAGVAALIFDAVGARTAFIEPGSPWENGYCESFNSKLRHEPLNGELLYSLAEVRIVIESWRQHYNTLRPNSSLGYKPLAPAAVFWTEPPTTSTMAAKPTMHWI